jgi:hypothetical protein
MDIDVLLKLLDPPESSMLSPFPFHILQIAMYIDHLEGITYTLTDDAEEE